MLRVRLLHAGQQEVAVTVEGDSAVIGRDAQCDVVVAQPYVRKRHVQILRGLVLVDQRSANGTFVKGEKVTQPLLLGDGLFNLADRLDVLVEVVDAATTTTTTSSAMLASRVDDLVLVREQLESERARAAVLAGEVAELRRRDQQGGSAGAGKLAGLEAENRDLRRRLDSLKEEVEGREVDAAASLQVRLANEELREVQRRNQELAARVRELEGRPPPSSQNFDSATPSQAEELQRLRAELERSRQAALPPVDLFAQLHHDNQELRARLEALESGHAVPPGNASEFFVQLQSENQRLQTENHELHRRLEQLESAPQSRVRAKAGAERSGSAAELGRVRAALRAAEEELARLRGEKGGSPGARVEATGGALVVLRLVVESDVERVDAGSASSAEDFLVLEAVRFLRKAERLVTRMAGSMVQILNPHTMLPDVDGNFRSLTARLLTLPDERGPRDELAAYLQRLSEWLVVAVGAPRKATLEFCAELKRELSEEGLTRKRPIPGIKIVPGQREAELWRRACEHLKELSPELIEDRIDKLCRETARTLLGSSEEVA